MRALVLLLWLLAGCAASRGGPRVRENQNCAWRVCITTENTRSGGAYRATNNEPIPATVTLTFKSPGNLRAGAGRPIVRVVPPGSSEILVRLSTIVINQSIRPQLSIAIDLGSSRTEPDVDHFYGVPFGGDVRRELTQGFGGAESHLGGMRYSLDFLMPEGTPIVAARGGIILYIQDGFTRGGTDPDLLEAANIVVVAHSDATMASYGHLRAGIPVSIGQRVREGDLLGSSGATGFAGRPHLHFHVGQRMLGEPGRTVPIKMRDREGRLLDLTPGLLVEPAAPYSR
jgi:murein DD-endopeptidase MepM/ murein hydrolase activator NlpD